MTPSNPQEWQSAIYTLNQKLSAVRYELSTALVAHESYALKANLGDSDAAKLFKTSAKKIADLQESVDSLVSSIHAAERYLVEAEAAASSAEHNARRAKIQAAIGARMKFLESFDKAANEYAQACIAEVANRIETATIAGHSFRKHVAPPAIMAVAHHLIREGHLDIARVMGFDSSGSGREAMQKSILEGFYGKSWADEALNSVNNRT